MTSINLCRCPYCGSYHYEVGYFTSGANCRCNDCALKDEEECYILIQGDEVTLCNLFSGHVLKIKED